jgi:hypothetical protein
MGNQAGAEAPTARAAAPPRATRPTATATPKAWDKLPLSGRFLLSIIISPFGLLYTQCRSITIYYFCITVNWFSEIK